MKKLTALLSTAVVGGTLVVAGAGWTTAMAAQSSTPQKGGTITVAESEEPDTLDPQKTGAAVSDIIMGQIGGALVFQDPKTLQYKPWLAKSWKISKDGLTWTFYLRHDVKFQNGDPLTAKDWVYTFKRALDPKTASVLTGSYLSNTKSITAPNKYTLVIKLKTPFSPFMADLSDAGYMSPLDSKAVNAEGSKYGRSPVSVGPWKFNNWQTGQSITLDTNPMYKWAPSFFKNSKAPYPDHLTFKFIQQEQTTIAALQTGQVDIASIQAKDIGQFQNNPNYTVDSALRQGLGLFLMFNVKKASMGDVKVRQAINYAIDKKSLIQAVESGHAVESYSALGPTIPDFDPNSAKYGYHFNVAKAKQVLASDGYKMGSDGYLQKGGKTLSLTLLSMQNGTWDLAAQLIQAQLKDIGIQVKINNLDWPTLLQTATAGNFDMTLMGYEYNDPDVLYLFLHSSQSAHGLNFDHVQDKTLDKLLVEGRTVMSPAARKKVYFELQKYISAKAYIAPIYTEQQFLVVSNKVHDLGFYPSTGPLYQDAWVAGQ